LAISACCNNDSAEGTQEPVDITVIAPTSEHISHECNNLLHTLKFIFLDF